MAPNLKSFISANTLIFLSWPQPNLGFKFDPWAKLSSSTSVISPNSSRLFGAEKLVHAFVSTRLDHCNTSPVRLARAFKYERMTPNLHTQQWLGSRRDKWSPLVAVGPCLSNALSDHLRVLLSVSELTRNLCFPQSFFWLIWFYHLNSFYCSFLFVLLPVSFCCTVHFEICSQTVSLLEIKSVTIEKGTFPSIAATFENHCAGV